MTRILPIVIVIMLVVGGLGYWRFVASKPNLTTPQAAQSDAVSIEVPKTLPQASLEDRVKALEDLTAKLVTQFNLIKSAKSPVPSSAEQLNSLEAAVTELKLRVSSLESVSPAPQTVSSKSTVYIPLGSGGGPWTDQAWNTLSEYQVVLDPANYPGYSSMQLEANFRLGEAAGTGSVRLYNVTDSGAISSQIDTTSTSFGVKTSNTFKLPSGQKTYTIQVQSSQGKNLFVQNARIRVNF